MSPETELIRWRRLAAQYRTGESGVVVGEDSQDDAYYDVARAYDVLRWGVHLTVGEYLDRNDGASQRGVDGYRLPGRGRVAGVPGDDLRRRSRHQHRLAEREESILKSALRRYWRKGREVLNQKERSDGE